MGVEYRRDRAVVSVKDFQHNLGSVLLRERESAHIGKQNGERRFADGGKIAGDDGAEHRRTHVTLEKTR